LSSGTDQEVNRPLEDYGGALRRWLIAGLVFLATGAVIFIALLYIWLALVIGGTECDRGECPPHPGWADGHDLLWMLIFSVVSVITGLLAASAFVRKRV
jgi:hypothetical protein